jgi:hypothetical protein
MTTLEPMFYERRSAAEEEPSLEASDGQVRLLETLAMNERLRTALGSWVPASLQRCIRLGSATRAELIAALMALDSSSSKR